jgi:hypothetical protein
LQRVIAVEAQALAQDGSIASKSVIPRCSVNASRLPKSFASSLALRAGSAVRRPVRAVRREDRARKRMGDACRRIVARICREALEHRRAKGVVLAGELAGGNASQRCDRAGMSACSAAPVAVATASIAAGVLALALDGAGRVSAGMFWTQQRWKLISIRVGTHRPYRVDWCIVAGVALSVDCVLRGH